MPRGKRKRGQYSVTVWLPDGARVEQYSTRDLSPFEYNASLRDVIAMLQRLLMDEPEVSVSRAGAEPS